MKSRTRKDKGRRLQVQLAEALSIHFGLTIEAKPPVQTGERASGALYVPESGRPDLQVKRMGEPGADVVLMSGRARGLVSVAGLPCMFECKNHEALEFGPKLWDMGALPVVREALGQCYAEAMDAGWLPCAVVSRNRWPVLVAWIDCFAGALLPVLHSTGATFLTMPMTFDETCYRVEMTSLQDFLDLLSIDLEGLKGRLR